jgi:hypothetical protein
MKRQKRKSSSPQIYLRHVTMKVLLRRMDHEADLLVEVAEGTVAALRKAVRGELGDAPFYYFYFLGRHLGWLEDLDPRILAEGWVVQLIVQGVEE